MKVDTQALARNIARLIPAESDDFGYRWMVYQMADTIEAYGRLLQEHDIPFPDPDGLPSSSMLVNKKGDLIADETNIVEPVGAPFHQ